MGEANDINKIIERTKNSKAMRYARDEFVNSIEEIISSKEFIDLYKKEFDIDITKMSTEALTIIMETLARY